MKELTQLVSRYGNTKREINDGIKRSSSMLELIPDGRRVSSIEKKRPRQNTPSPTEISLTKKKRIKLAKHFHAFFMAPNVRDNSRTPPTNQLTLVGTAVLRPRLITSDREQEGE